LPTSGSPHTLTVLQVLGVRHLLRYAGHESFPEQIIGRMAAHFMCETEAWLTHEKRARFRGEWRYLDDCPTVDSLDEYTYPTCVSCCYYLAHEEAKAGTQWSATNPRMR
jgi:hypothetical protein